MFARPCTIAFLIFGLVQASVLPVRAADAAVDLPDVATLRARVAAAQGTRPDRERLTETFSVGGSTGQTIVQRSGKDVRNDTTFGPFTTASGTFGGQRWRQNANGETVLVQPDPGHAPAEKKTITVARVSTPINGYVIAELNARGEGTKEYIDPVTYRIVRREEIDPVATTVTSYDDFRKTDGFERPWHWTVRDGHPENDAEHRIVSEDNAGVADLHVPANRKIFVEFPAGKTTVDLPVREVAGQFIVRVQIGDRGYDFTLDSGAGGIVMDQDVVRQLGLKEYDTGSNGYNAGRIQELRTVIPAMSVGELKMHDVVVETMPPLAVSDNPLYKSVGLLGFDFIGDVALSMDYMNGRVTATTPEAFKPPKDRQTFAIPVRLGSGTPETDVVVNDALGEHFAVDTGWGTNMAIFDYFARRHPEAMRGAAIYLENQQRLIGVGGEVKTTPYKFASVKLSNIVFKDFIAERVASTKQYAGGDGVIGVGLLQHFTLYTDYINSMLYLVPNGRRDV